MFLHTFKRNKWEKKDITNESDTHNPPLSSTFNQYIYKTNYTIIYQDILLHNRYKKINIMRKRTGFVDIHIKDMNEVNGLSRHYEGSQKIVELCKKNIVSQSSQ